MGLLRGMRCFRPVLLGKFETRSALIPWDRTSLDAAA